MKKVNRCYLLGILFLLLGTIKLFAQHNSKIPQPYDQSFGGSYLSLEANVTTGKLKNNYSNNDYFDNYSSWSNTIDYTLGAGLGIYKNYFATIKVGRRTFEKTFRYYEMPDKQVVSEREHFQSIPYFTMLLGVEKYYSISNRKLHLVTNPNFLAIRAKELHKQVNGLSIHSTQTSKKWLLGFSFKLGIEYQIYKRYALYLNGSANYIANSKHINYTEIYIPNPTFNTQTDIATISKNPFFLDGAIGIKISLENSAFY